MLADEPAGCPLQSVKIHRPTAIPHIRSEKWRTNPTLAAGAFPALKDPVLVCFANGAITRMKAFRNGFRRRDPDAGRKVAVQSSQKIRRRDRSFDPHRSHLRQRMHTGVSPSRSLGQRRLSRDLLDCLGEPALDGGKPGLHLPAVKAGAVITERELPLGHRWHPTMLRGPGQSSRESKQRRGSQKMMFSDSV